MFYGKALTEAELTFAKIHIRNRLTFCERLVEWGRVGKNGEQW